MSEKSAGSRRRSHVVYSRAAIAIMLAFWRNRLGGRRAETGVDAEPARCPFGHANRAAFTLKPGGRAKRLGHDKRADRLGSTRDRRSSRSSDGSQREIRRRGDGGASGDRRGGRTLARSRVVARSTARLDQIELQWEGPSALISRKAVAEAIAIEPKQRVLIARAVAIRDRRRSEGQDLARVEGTLAPTFSTFSTTSNGPAGSRSGPAVSTDLG